MPANEHYHTAPHDVETSPLFLHKPSTLSSKSTPPLWGGILHEWRRRSWWWTAPSWWWWWWWPFFLWQLPLLIKVERWGTLISTSASAAAATTCGCRSSRSHILEEKNLTVAEKIVVCVLGEREWEGNQNEWLEQNSEFNETESLRAGVNIFIKAS